ncbi:MAG: HAMP domain-containing histidine kinase, partial [Phycisphaerae bacterium]|nr:HAMP domain-containing histidine kinase [Phycisphaerae bacterium]
LRAVSHDLNAPLRNIAGLATIMMMKWPEELPEEAIARLGRIQANVDCGISLISELLELSHIKTRPQKRQVVDMTELISEVIGAFEFEARTRSITLEVEGHMPSLYIERVRFRQVFQNLIDNAVKYMHRKKGGKVEIGYKALDGAHQFHVADNGPGIPHDQQQKIFYVFRRATSAAAAKIEGKGIGLALVKGVVSNYGGRAWVHSELDEGSTFYIELDAQCTAPPADEVASESHQVGQDCKERLPSC